MLVPSAGNRCPLQALPFSSQVDLSAFKPRFSTYQAGATSPALGRWSGDVPFKHSHVHFVSEIPVMEQIVSSSSSSSFFPLPQCSQVRAHGLTLPFFVAVCSVPRKGWGISPLLLACVRVWLPLFNCHLKAILPN